MLRPHLQAPTISPQSTDDRKMALEFLSLAPDVYCYTMSTWVALTRETSSEDTTKSASNVLKTKYVFWFVFDVSVMSSFILTKFNVTAGTPMTLKQFRVKLAEQLIGNYCSRKRAGQPRKRPSSPTAPISSTHPHTLRVHAVSTAEMFVLLHVEETVWACTACEGHPLLCLTGKQDGSDCFRLWHGL